MSTPQVVTACVRVREKSNPIEVCSGSSRVKIYACRKPNRKYFTVAWHAGPKRHRRNFKTLEEAKALARAEAEKPAAGQVHSPTVTTAQAQDMKEALRRLGPVDTPLHVVAGEYADVDRQAVIDLGSDQTKTASRRPVPILDTLKAWITPFVKREGPVLEYSLPGRGILKLGKKADKARKAADPGASTFKWKTNALRHSFASYRLAVVEDVAKVSLEMGNSPQKIFSNYRKVVTKSRAQAWFAVLPDAPQNVVPMHAVA